MKTRQTKTLRCSKGSHKREVYSNPDLLKEGRKVSGTQPNLTPKRTGKRTANKAPKQQKNGNNKGYSRNQLYRNKNNSKTDQ